MIAYPGCLHSHTHYSNIRLRDCINKENELIDYAIKLGHEVIAITDHDCIASAIKVEKYYNQIKKDHPNFKVILGNEIYLCRNGLNNDTFIKGQDRYYHFILLAKDAIGHEQIRQLSTRAWIRSYMSRGMRRVPTYYQDLFDIIAENKGHVIGSTACLGGALPTQLLKWRDTNDDSILKKIYIWINQLDNIFGHGNFYLELQPSNNKDQTFVNSKLILLSKELDIPYIITTDAHYLKKEDRVIHKAYLNAQNGDREVDDFYSSTYMMDHNELESYFDYLTVKDLQIAYKNIIDIKNKCEDFSLLKSLKIPELIWRENDCIMGYKERLYLYSKMPTLQKFLSSEYESDRKLVDAILCGILNHKDLQNDAAYYEIESNLQMTWTSSQINNARWSAYFLNLQKIIDSCWDANSIVGPGRGSGVGFILLYVLDITQINPLREKTRTMSWRFLNPDRVSVLDVDFDIEGSKRAQVLNNFRKIYGADRVANVATFRTEKSKSAILTAARGLGIDVDIAQYIASLIPADRGMLRTLSQCMNGDKDNDWKPIKQFVFEMTEQYPELWKVAKSIEGLICGSGVHAGGIIFVDEPFTNSTALMRAPDGTICTQFELHDAEDVSLIKYDALSVEAMDKIHYCLDLLIEYGYIEDKGNLKDTYESVLGIYNLERTNIDMWKMVWEHKIDSLFQMEKQSGKTGIAILHPTSVDDLAILNSTIRLMAQEKGGEMPTEKLARFKNNPDDWLHEMNKYHLGESEQKLLEPILGMSYGLCIAQEQFMELVQLPELGGFSLTWADKLRKSIAKKNPKEYDLLTKEFFNITSEKGIDQNLAHYVWDVLIAMSRGYGFNQSHTLAYSLIGLQEMNLAYRFPILFWNCACLISDAGGNANDEEFEDEYGTLNCIDEQYYNEMEEFCIDDEKDVIDSYNEDEDCDGYPVEIKILNNGKKKKKTKTTNYGRISSAIGRIQSTGVIVTPPDINNSKYTFSPDIDNNVILYGLSGINKIGQDIVQDIINHRPFNSIDDFMEKIKLNKAQMISLIKSGAFDEFGDRQKIMQDFIHSICGEKTTLNLRNMKMLLEFNLLPSELDFECKVFNFNKYLKQFKDDLYYQLDENSLRFYEQNYDMDLLSYRNNNFYIEQKQWDKIYKKEMNPIRDYIKENLNILLDKVNDKLFQDEWNKYCLGNLSKWEMDSVSFYYHEHELNNINHYINEWSDFYQLSETPDIDTMIYVKGKQVPLFKIHRIAGTVLDRDKNKKTITLLTTTGVVTVKIFGPVFAFYDKQISERGIDGKKHVIEKSFFNRGNKIVVSGIRRDDAFIAKKYKRNQHHLVEQIINIDENGLAITKVRSEMT